MSLTFSIILLILSLLGCMILKIDLVYGLLIWMAAFMAAAAHAGFRLKNILRMMWEGIRESFIVVGVLLIIGAMTGAWRAGGTIQQLVVYGTELIHPKLFILFAFLLPMAVSYLIGTSFGTAASIGVVMMTLCRMSGADPVLTASHKDGNLQQREAHAEGLHPRHADNDRDIRGSFIPEPAAKR